MNESDTPLYDERVLLRAEQGLAVVISQCCEFNEGKRNAFSLARLTRVRDALRPTQRLWGFNLAQLVPAKWVVRATDEAIEKLRRANRIDEQQQLYEAVNTYLYEPEGSTLLEPHVVDFTQVVSIRMEDKASVLRWKVLQIDKEHRSQLQLKLGYFYSRPAE